MNEVERLQRRIERERAARHEAETIAERGLRELFHANAELDQRVAARTAELETARAELLAAQSTRQAILANLSHELRTPLHAVVASLDLIGPDPAENEELLDMARREAGNLDRLLARLFDLIEIDGRSLVAQLGRTDVHNAVTVAAARWRAASLANGQLLVVEAVGMTPPALADADRLDQALDHLLSNAVTHGVAGPVRCRVQVVDSGAIRCSIADAGPGFDPGVTWGAGLKTSAGLLEAMGAELHIDSAPGRGTTLSFDLAEFGAELLVA